MRNMKPPTSEARNVRTRSSLTSRIGAGTRRACHAYSASSAVPPAISAAIHSFESRPRPRFSKPSIVPASPRLTMQKPATSSGSSRGSRTFGMKRIERRSPRIPIGMLIRKIQRHENQVTMNPPSGGPITGPISAGTVR
jgi:hypothetical protein